MSRDLLLLLLGATLLEPFAFDDDGGDEDPDDDDPDDDPEDPDDDPDDDKDDAKKSSKKTPKTESPEALKKQVSDLQKKLKDKNRRITDLARERAKLNRQVKGGGKAEKKDSDGDGDDGGGDDSEVAQLRKTVTKLTERLDDLSSENFIEKNVIRRLQPLITAGLDDAAASRKLNAAMKLVDPEEDFDDEGNFDADGFLERYPYLAVEPEEKTARDRLLGGSGKKVKDKKDYAKEALERFNAQGQGTVKK